MFIPYPYPDFIKPFENKNLKENCIKQPCFKFAIEEAEYSEKDRIIENSIYECSIDIKLQQTENFIFWRYIEAINKMLVEKESDIIEVVDQFTGLILNRIEREAFSPLEALVVLR